MRTKILLAVLLGLMLVSNSRAQDPAPSPAAPSGPMVGLSMIVTDKDGKGVNTIQKDQIRVSEDGNEQTVLGIEADERPVDYVIALDSSGSLHKLFDSAVEAAKLFIVNRRPQDQIALVRFVSSDSIEKVLEFSADNTLLLKEIDASYLSGGQSAVVDALYLSAQYVDEYNKSNEGRRKIVVVITDGEDRSSWYTQEKLTKLLRESGVQVFILGLVVELNKQASPIRQSPREKAEKLLNDVAEESGGRVFYPANKEQLVDAAAQIVFDVRAQFRIRYQSTQATKKGFRKVDVKYVAAQGDEKRNLIVPRGYWFGPRPSAKSEKKKKS